MCELGGVKSTDLRELIRVHDVTLDEVACFDLSTVLSHLQACMHAYANVAPMDACYWHEYGQHICTVLPRCCGHHHVIPPLCMRGSHEPALPCPQLMSIALVMTYEDAYGNHDETPEGSSMVQIYMNMRGSICNSMPICQHAITCYAAQSLCSAMLCGLP